MESRQARKDAIRDYRERQPQRGVFAIRCAGTGGVWVGSSPDLEAARNGQWFFLRQGDHREATLQAEWNARGEQAFSFEILERLKEDLSPMEVKDQLKERLNHWIARLGARRILP